MLYLEIFFKKILVRLNGIQNSNSYGFSSFLNELESTLKLEYNNILEMEEDFMKLRSRVNCLNEGEKNSNSSTYVSLTIEEKIRLSSLKTYKVIG